MRRHMHVAVTCMLEKENNSLHCSIFAATNIVEQLYIHQIVVFVWVLTIIGLPCRRAVLSQNEYKSNMMAATAATPQRVTKSCQRSVAHTLVQL
jgi:hypothetical protein